MQARLSGPGVEEPVTQGGKPLHKIILLHQRPGIGHLVRGCGAHRNPAAAARPLQPCRQRRGKTLEHGKVVRLGGSVRVWIKPLAIQGLEGGPIQQLRPRQAQGIAIGEQGRTIMGRVNRRGVHLAAQITKGQPCGLRQLALAQRQHRQRGPGDLCARRITGAPVAALLAQAADPGPDQAGAARHGGNDGAGQHKPGGGDGKCRAFIHQRQIIGGQGPALGQAGKLVCVLVMGRPAQEPARVPDLCAKTFITAHRMGKGGAKEARLRGILQIEARADQRRRIAAGFVGEAVLADQRHRQAAAQQRLRRAGPGNAAANDEHRAGRRRGPGRRACRAAQGWPGRPLVKRFKALALAPVSWHFAHCKPR